jgi:hypothetical protein
MRNRGVVLAFGALLPAVTALAEPIYFLLVDLLPGTDLAAVATLENVREWTKDETDFGEGVLRVESVLFGPSRRKVLRLTWRNPSTLICPRIDHNSQQGIRSLWLLTVHGEEGSVRADRHGGVISLTDRAAVRAAYESLASAPEAARDARYRAVRALLARQVAEK